MTKQQSILGLIGVCVVMVVLSLLGLASDFITHLLGNIDGLLLLAVCLMIAIIFGVMLFPLAKEEVQLEHEKHAENSASAKPAPEKTPAGVSAGVGEGK